MEKINKERVAIVATLLLASLIIYMLCIGDVSGFDNTYLSHPVY